MNGAAAQSGVKGMCFGIAFAKSYNLTAGVPGVPPLTM